MISIYQFQIDEAGNQGWVLMNQLEMDLTAVQSYLEGLASDGHTYAAEITLGNDTMHLAQVP